MKDNRIRGKIRSKSDPRKVIADAELFNTGWQELEAALTLPEYHNYSSKNLQLQLSVLPPESNIQTRLPRLAAKASYPVGFELLHIVYAFHIKVLQARKSGDERETEALFQLFLSLSKLISEDEPPNDGLVELIHFSFIRAVSANFSEPLSKTLLTPIQQSQLEEIEAELTAINTLKDQEVGNSIDNWKSAGIISRITGFDTFGSLSPPLKANELEPERRFWQTILERYAVLFTSGILFFFAAIFAGRFRTRKPLPLIARQLERTVTLRKLALLAILIGMAVLLHHFFWTRMTRFGYLQYSWVTTPAHLNHLIIVAALLLILAINTGRFLSYKRLAPLHLAKRLPLTSWWPVPLAIMAYPLSALPLVDSFMGDEMIPLVLAALFIFWIFWLIFRRFSVTPSQRIANALAARYACLILVMLSIFSLATLPILELRSKYWFGLDHLNDTNQHPYGMNRIGSETTLIFHQRFLDLHQRLAELGAQAPPP